MDTWLSSLLSNARWQVEGASDDDLADAADVVGFPLPPELLALLRQHDGVEGLLGNRPLELWSARRIAAEAQDQEVTQSVPGLLVFGSLGGHDLLGFLPRLPFKPWGRISMLAGSAEEFVPLATGLPDLLDALAHGR